MSTRKCHRDAATHREPDQDEAVDPEVIEQRFEVVRHGFCVVAPLGIPTGVPVPTLIHRQDAVVLGDTRDEIIPEVRLIAMTVEQDERNALRAPFEDMEFEVVAGLDAVGDAFHAEIVSRGPRSSLSETWTEKWVRPRVARNFQPRLGSSIFGSSGWGR
jgi:hypothetical protein